MTIAAGRALHPGAIYIHGAAAVESIAMDGQSIASEVAAAVTHNSDLTQTHAAVCGGRRGSSVLAGERKGSSSHSGEWRGGGVLSGAREKARAVSCTSTNY